ncbi:MAG: diadenylate cyclase CdaA [Gemmatimonadota bacterium]|nr:diadenylate cyclase CdaA [Gemmatimonadota bacterium]
MRPFQLPPAPSWRDITQGLLILLAALYMLRALKLRRAVHVVGFLGALLLAYGIAWVLEFHLIMFLLRLVLEYGTIALLVVLAPELRAVATRLGRPPFSRGFREMDTHQVAGEIHEAVERLSRSGIGAIIALERDTTLDDFAESGSRIEARVSADLLMTIFTPYSPLHDGAVIVRGDTIIAAGCILPLSQKVLTDRALGTRHRAALGLSDESDALVIVVSEERATVSVAQGGRLWRDLTPPQLREALEARAVVSDEDLPSEVTS